MRELKTILALHRERQQAGAPSVLATVVRARGSTYRRAGARLLMAEDRWLAGGVSGGCLEADLLRKAWWRTADGEAVVVRYDATTRDDEDLPWSFGLGCRGAIDVLLERLDPDAPANPLTFLARAMAARAASVLVTVIQVAGDVGEAKVKVGDRAMLDETSRCETTVAGGPWARPLLDLAACALAAQTSSYASVTHAGAEIEVFVERVPAPQSLVICGGGYDAVPVVACAAELGWDVTVVDCRKTAASARAFAGAVRVVRCAPDAIADHVLLGERTAAVVMSHHYEVDRAALATLVPRALAYLGILGPRERTDRLLGELEHAGQVFTSAQLARLHAPVGLDLGGNFPEEIALAIVAEVQKTIAHGSGLSLAVVKGAGPPTRPRERPLVEGGPRRADA